MNSSDIHGNASYYLSGHAARHGVVEQIRDDVDDSACIKVAEDMIISRTSKYVVR